MRPPLTDPVLKRAISDSRKPGASRLEISDGGAVGLFVRVEPTTKGGPARYFWCVRYVVKGGRRRLEIKPGESMKHVEARAWASSRRMMARSGVDPVEKDKRVAREALAKEADAIVAAHESEMEARTVVCFFEGFECERGYLARHISLLAQSRQTEQLWRNHILPAIGSTSVRSLSRGDVAEALEKMRDKGLTGQVNRAQSAISHFLGWLVDLGKLDTNVAMGMRRRVKERSRKRVLDDGELRSLWLASDKLSPIASAFIRLLILTGQRRDDVRLMAWSELGNDGLWTIPAERYKIRQEHDLVLSRQAVVLVEDRRGDGGPYVLSGRGEGKPFNGARSVKAQLDSHLPDDMAAWVLHDIRRTVRTGMAALGVREEIAERAIGHVQGAMVETYNRHRYLEEKRKAFQAWADHLERLVSEPDNVLSFAR
jgi:integrase